MDLVVKLQSTIRGFLQRIKFQRLRNQYNAKKTKYFTTTESRQTVTQTTILRPTFATFRYSTGAVYEGDWLGGLRHGTGKMTWPDGTYYLGKWAFNAAHG